MHKNTDNHTPDHTIVFVYGTLKRGLWNNMLLAGATYLGTTKTTKDFDIYCLGSDIPFLSHETRNDVKKSVSGELWRVDARTLAGLDALEGHPLTYTRTPITLACGTDAECYLFNRETNRKRLYDVFDVQYGVYNYAPDTRFY